LTRSDSHFIVSYEGETMETTGRMVLDALERAALPDPQLGYEPEELVVILLPAPPWEGPIGGRSVRRQDPHARRRAEPGR
jgi:hypothetical protein